MQRKFLRVSIYDRLRYQILSGEWPSESQLPPERKLAEEWSVSRNTIVNAYADLAAEGLVVSKAGSGRYVRPLPPADMSMNWKNALHQSSVLYSPSPLTRLHTLAGDKKMINFAFGEGGKHTLVNTDFGQVCDMNRILETSSADYLIPILGHPALRQWIVDWVNDEFITGPEQVMMTSGSQEALYLTASILAKPGDSVVVEMPTFFGALQVFQSLGLHIIPIPVDQHGMKVEVLDGVLSRTRPRFIYINPTFQNPTGTVLSMDRRERLLRISAKFDVPIVEDDAYRHLHFDAEPPAPLKALDKQGNVIYINTFSKVLFPGLRLGWITANRPFLELLARRKELSVTTNTFAQQTLLAYLQKGSFPKHLEQMRALYKRQAGVMEKHLAGLRSMGVSFTPSSGGFYLWVGLPEGFNPMELLQKASEQGVLFATGDMFLTREVQQPYIRLSYSHEDGKQIEQGMRILSSILHAL